MVEKCCGEVLQGSVVEKCFREVLCFLSVFSVRFLSVFSVCVFSLSVFSFCEKSGGAAWYREVLRGSVVGKCCGEVL